MKIAGFDWKKYHRHFRTPLSTAKGIISGRSGILIRITSNNGISGYGEAAPLPGYSKDSLDDITGFMENSGGIIRDIMLSGNCDQIFHSIASCIPVTLPSLRFACETACGDIMAKAAGLPLARWLSDVSRFGVAVNYLFPRSSKDWDFHIRAIRDGGYGSVKIKLGAMSHHSDIFFVWMLGKALGDDIALRLDANRSWTYDIAKEVSTRLSHCNIEYVEEPLAYFNSDLLYELRRESFFKIALDESLAEMDHIEPDKLRDVCDVLILKPTILGGISRTLTIASHAAACRMPIVITSSFETEVGLTALAHLAAALPGELLACGLDTLRLFDDATDLFGGVQNGLITLPNKPGLGIEVDW